MTEHGFQHFLTNEEPDHVLFRCLKESGIFVFDTRFPPLEDLSGQPTFRRSVNDAQGRTVQIYTKEQYDPIQQIEHCKVIRRFLMHDGWLKRGKVPSFSAIRIRKRQKRISTASRV